MDSVSPRITRRQFVASSSAALAAGSFVSQAFAASSPVAGQNQIAGRGPFRVVIDTDPGVDDALALLLAMRSPELKIEAITPVAGNVPLELSLPNALRMVEIAGRTDIPVAVGAKAPLLRRLVTAAYAHGENGLGGAAFPEPKIKPIAEPAAKFISQIVRKYPGEVTLITIGPLTNIATALNMDSELARIVKSLFMMGGSLSGGNITPAAEFNVYVDPEAARIVFQSGNAINHNREQGFLVGPNMHDSLAVAGFLEPSLLKFQDYYVDVETTGELTAGETLGYSPMFGDLQRRPESEKQAALTMQIRGSAPTLASTKTSPVVRDKFVPNAKVAIKVDSARFFDLLIGRLS